MFVQSLYIHDQIENKIEQNGFFFSQTVLFIHSYNIKNYLQYFNIKLLYSSWNEVMNGDENHSFAVEILKVILNIIAVDKT